MTALPPLITRVGVFFGGRSVEHEVSVITASQAMSAMAGSSLEAVPVYIAKDGAWYTGDALTRVDTFRESARVLADATRVTMRPDPQGGGALLAVSERRGLLGGGPRPVAQLDVALPLVHGTHGEDGTLQGLFELCDVAYCGSAVAAAALSMDKRLTKAAFRAAGLSVLDDVLVQRRRWERDADPVVAESERSFAFPVYVKPVSTGSSIGVSRAENRAQLRDAVALALTYDTCCLIEPGQDGAVEINCAVLGQGDDVRASACEQPKAGGLLTYEDKYLRKSGKAGPPELGGKSIPQRVVPAELGEAMTRQVQETSMAAFRAINAAGVARVDCFVRTGSGSVVVNEINTVPGSLAFHLWEPVGVSMTQLVTQLVDMARSRHLEKARTAYSIDTWLLTGPPGG